MAKWRWDSLAVGNVSADRVAVGIVIVVIIIALATWGWVASYLDTREVIPQRNAPAAAPRITANSTPTLREYWDLAACLDLYDRVELAIAAGFSDEQLVNAIAAPGNAVSRYGLDDVLDHCTGVFSKYD